MYSFLLLIHSWMRWVVLIAGIFALVRAFGGWRGTRPWTRVDDTAGMSFIGALDLQVLLGLLLYVFLSPFGLAAFENGAEVMRNSALRFWAVEHTFGMVIAVVLAHIGRVKGRKAPAARMHRTTAIFYALALAAMLASIPWPGTPAGRVLFRW